MRVEARSNSGAALPAGYLDARRGYTESTDFALTIGSEYAVYGLTTFLGGAWYYILDDDRAPWPIWQPAPLFDIVDPRLPAGWEVGYHRWPHLDRLLVSWPEWANDHGFYERLVDRNKAEQELFRNWVRQSEPHKESYLNS